MKNPSVVFLLALALGAPEVAGQTPPPSARPVVAVTPAEAPPDVARLRRARRETLPATLQMRVVVSDQAGNGEPQRRQLDLRLAEGERFFLRTDAQNTAARPRLNADARAEVVGDRVALQLTLEYGGQELGAEGNTRSGSNFKYQWSELVLDLGKPTLVLQTADPAAERKIAIEVTVSAVRP